MSNVVWWRDIPGYDGWYQINEHGEVRSWRVKGRSTERAKKPTTLRGCVKNGSHRVVLNDNDGIAHCYTIKRLMNAVGYETEPNRIKRRAIEKVDEHGNVLKRYPSVLAASKENYMSSTTIRYYCNGNNKNLMDGICTFRYAEERE